MPESIRPRGPGANNARLEQALEANAEALLHNKVPARGPSASEQSAMERKAAGATTRGLRLGAKAAGHVGAHGLGHVMSHSKTAAAGVIGKALVGGLTLHMIEKLVATRFESAELNAHQKAQIRDGYSAATLKLIGEGLLPGGFAQARRQELQSPTGLDANLLQEMHRRLTRDLRSPEQAELVMRQLQGNARRAAVEGMEYAAAFDLRSEPALQALLARDASFRARYGEDLAFREGVRAMAWLGQTDPADFDARKRLFEQPRASSPHEVLRQLQGVKLGWPCVKPHHAARCCPTTSGPPATPAPRACWCWARRRCWRSCGSNPSSCWARCCSTGPTSHRVWGCGGRPWRSAASPRPWASAGSFSGGSSATSRRPPWLPPRSLRARACRPSG